ncbi:hypothetical protein TrST_g5199 [Triparma strigata]|uniref:Cilia- and flagella-associated protein 91 n=1 Tax=Triparma strigata TaxID=1606541 RepID=A0A9W7EV16_9STRA|nr:hypothetical protein TrST_g5199 [Triparma strigata]
MSYTRTIEQRAYDHLYDPVYTTPETGLYRQSNAPVKAAAEPGNDVSGTARHKYFKQPLVPHLHAVAPEVLLAPTAKQDPLAPPAMEDEPLTKAVGVQTKYRDSEAQTNPYTPQFVVREDQEEPEVMMLDGLGEGSLPAGAKEVSMIERAREKRALEASLPPITDEASLNLRKRLMEQQELREYSLREAEFDAMREKRLTVLRKAIDERDASNEFLAEQRVEALRQRKMEQRDKALTNIQNRRIKALRKLSKARKDVPTVGALGSRKNRDIIGEYADFSSKVYAPIRRDGKALDSSAGGKFDVLSKTAPMDSLENIAKMEATIPSKLTKTAIRKPQKQQTKTAADRKNLALTADLQLMDTIIKSDMGDEDVQNATVGASTAPSATNASPGWRTKTKKVERPATPLVPEVDEEAENEHMALILLQRLLRGRAVQNTMFEGKERRIELIKELRASEGIEQGDPGVLTQPERKARVHEAAIDTIAGETTSALFDFLSKELVRKEEKDKLQAMAAAAEKERQKREIEEGGKRQAEELLRSREDEAYRQITRMHHAAATTFVSNLMEQALEKVVAELVMKFAKGEAGGKVEATETADVEASGKELVGSFLKAEADGIADASKEGETDARILDAAQATVSQVMSDVTVNSTL